jgi:hypothetical protein
MSPGSSRFEGTQLGTWDGTRSLKLNGITVDPITTSLPRTTVHFPIKSARDTLWPTMSAFMFLAAS